MVFNPRELQSPFYRVAARAIVFDDHGRVLVIKDKYQEYELPGGGWEYDEDFETAIRRELKEEVGVDVQAVGDVAFTYRGFGEWGYWTLRLVAPVSLVHGNVVSPGDGMIAAHYVTRDEFLTLQWCDEDAAVIHYVDKIWSLVEKKLVKR